MSRLFLPISIIILLLSSVKPVDAKKIALTFDADLTIGMLARLKSGKVKTYYNSAMADYIVSQKLPVTIFVTGLYAQTYHQQLKNLSANSYIEFENHSYDHRGFQPSCYGLGVTTNKTQEITKANSEIISLTGKLPTWFRYPGGCHNQQDDKLVSSLGLKVAGWTIVSGDAFNPNYQKVANHVVTSATDNSVVVMHFGTVNAPATSRALPLIVNRLRNQGYEFTTLNQL